MRDECWIDLVPHAGPGERYAEGSSEISEIGQFAGGSQ